MERNDSELVFAGRDQKKPRYYLAIASNADLSSLDITRSRLVDLGDALIGETSRRFAGLERLIDTQKGEIADLSRALKAEEHQASLAGARILELERSLALQLLKRYQRATDSLLPLGTVRRRVYQLPLTAAYVILTEGWRSFWSKSVVRVIRSSGRSREPK